jgi:hypothetical protein
MRHSLRYINVLCILHIYFYMNKSLSRLRLFNGAYQKSEYNFIANDAYFPHREILIVMILTRIIFQSVNIYHALQIIHADDISIKHITVYASARRCLSSLK